MDDSGHVSLPEHGEGEEDLARTLEVAALVMHPESDEEPETPVEP